MTDSRVPKGSPTASPKKPEVDEGFILHCALEDYSEVARETGEDYMAQGLVDDAALAFTQSEAAKDLIGRVYIGKPKVKKEQLDG